MSDTHFDGPVISSGFIGPLYEAADINLLNDQTGGAWSNTIAAITAATAATTDTSAASLASVNASLTAQRNALASLAVKINAMVAAVASPAPNGSIAAILTGTPMVGQTLTVVPGFYPFKVNSYSRQLQISDDGISGWTDSGAAFGGTTTTVGALSGKYLRVVEQATGPQDKMSTTSLFIGPVVANVALPSLPFAVGAKFAVFGDSHAGLNNYFGSIPTSPQNLSYGFVSQAECIDPRFRSEIWYDTSDPNGRNFNGYEQGVAGDHLNYFGSPALKGIIPRMVTWLDTYNADFIMFEGGSNSISSGDGGNGVPATAQYCIQELDLALSIARQKGKPCIITTIYPRNDWSLTDPRQTTLREVNNWIRTQSTRDGVQVIDPFDALCWPNGMVRSQLYQADKVHLLPSGALVVGRDYLLPAIQNWVSAGTYYSQDASDSNLFATSLWKLQGTGGTKANSVPGNTVTGNNATGTVLSRGRNCTLIGSKEVISGDTERQVIQCIPGGTDNGAYSEYSLSTLTAMEPNSPTQWYYGAVQIELDDTDAIAFASLQVSIRNGGSTVLSAFGMQRLTSGEFATSQGGGARSYWVKTPPFFNYVGTTFDRLVANIVFTCSKTAPTHIVKISYPIIRRYADPRPDWGY